ncbi:FixH family protein [bacterium]|nr:FixH family protein [bacterium]
MNTSKIWRFAVVTLALLVLAGCPDTGDDDDDDAASGGEVTSEDGRFTATFELSPDDPVAGENALVMTLYDAGGQTIEGADVTAEPFMPSMGHGSDEEPAVEELGGGVYRVENIVYTMAGAWELAIDVTADGVSDTFALEFDVT